MLTTPFIVLSAACVKSVGGVTELPTVQREPLADGATAACDDDEMSAPPMVLTATTVAMDPAIAEQKANNVTFP